MKLFTPEISWHQKEPIFSVDFCPQTWKLASCGADFTVKIWRIKEKADDDVSIGIEFLANLDRHAKPVNVVRFSPNGKFLASAGDDGTIILWKLNENEKCSPDIFEDNGIVNKESWMVHKMLRGHIEDVYDLAWSPDSAKLISGSVDNSAILWDAVKGQSQKILTDHKHYVQGVCWDPRNFYVATHSSDRSCRLYQTTSHRCMHNIHKNTTMYKKNGQLTKSKYSRMFMDETMQSFFRRCTFSPDGSFLFLPAGLCDGEQKPKKTTYVFARGHYKWPIRHLPGSKKATVAVKCSPIVYELREDKENLTPIKENNEYFKVPYRMVYAVASLDAITFYDTQHEHPIGHCANMHYASLTDITWSSDGKYVVISSTDGYCSFVKFDDGELGTPILYDPIEYQVTQAQIRKAAKKDSKKKESKKVDSEKLDATTPVENQKATPTRTDEKKEKMPIVKSIDRNQPTIEKLFVTPMRKRKRPSDTSPLSSSEPKKIITSNASDTLKSPTFQCSVVQESKSQNIKNMLSPSNIKSTPKAAKRAQVVTCLASPTLVSPPKPPKRASVTTLETFSVEKPADDKGSGCTNVSGETSKVEHKAPKRVSVTTLKTFTDETEKTNTVNQKNILTPSTKSTPEKKKPKRAIVTTLATFSSTDQTTPNKNESTKQRGKSQTDGKMSSNKETKEENKQKIVEVITLD